MNCQECKDRMYPENPSQPFYLQGHYLRPLCESCPHYGIKIKNETHPIFRPRPVDREIDQLKSGFIHLQNKLNEHLDKSKKQNKSAF